MGKKILTDPQQQEMFYQPKLRSKRPGEQVLQKKQK